MDGKARDCYCFDKLERIIVKFVKFGKFKFGIFNKFSDKCRVHFIGILKNFFIVVFMLAFQGLLYKCRKQVRQFETFELNGNLFQIAVK
jgi:hypothetical protein